MLKTAESGSCAPAPAECAMFTSLCMEKKRSECTVFPEKERHERDQREFFRPFLLCAV